MRLEAMVRRGLTLVGCCALVIAQNFAHAQTPSPQRQSDRSAQQGSNSKKTVKSSSSRDAQKARSASPGSKADVKRSARSASQRSSVKQEATPARASFGQRAGLHGTPDPLDLRSSVALVVDQDTQQVLFSKNPDALPESRDEASSEA